jgi:hypothetical protein
MIIMPLMNDLKNCACLLLSVFKCGSPRRWCTRASKHVGVGIEVMECCVLSFVYHKILSSPTYSRVQWTVSKNSANQYMHFKVKVFYCSKHHQQKLRRHDDGYLTPRPSLSPPPKQNTSLEHSHAGYNSVKFYAWMYLSCVNTLGLMHEQFAFYWHYDRTICNSQFIDTMIM